VFDPVVPPKAKPAALVPAPANSLLAVAKLAEEVVQFVPSYSSVVPVLGGINPPKPKPAV
jgi:hypothetical protein